ncbi:MAG TPA: hypothetical protein PKK67_10405 [Cyclobacteriaceae bacterium]|jgi:hypothetical protein|nr:hypothetical protein [Cytophagales bacterium]HNT50989.1 hypothetical protein [Cyclobacteriaceae bacterium]
MKLKLLTLAFSLLIIQQVYAQGCSDAGFCTMGAMKPDQPYNKKIPIKLRSVEVSFYRGTTTLSPVVYVANLDASFNVIDDKTFFQVKVPYQAVDGNFGKTNGLGDLSLCLTRNLYSSEKFDISVSVGSKIPSNKSNLRSKENGLMFPMYYQTSLGTYDAIAGISLINKQWLFATGIQHPFNQNENTFTWGAWIPVYANGEGEDYVRDNMIAYNLKRGTDVMLRVERNFRYARFNFTLGLLPIFRITQDEITDINTNQRIKLDGTTGMALSGIGTVGYNFNVKSGVRLLFGKKITQRKVNPDGLTRHDVTTISYYYRF